MLNPPWKIVDVNTIFGQQSHLFVGEDCWGGRCDVFVATETPQSLFWSWKQHHFNASAFVVGKFGVLCLYQSIFQEMHTTHGKSTMLITYLFETYIFKRICHLPVLKKTQVSHLKSQDFTKRHVRLWKSQENQTKLPQKWGPNLPPAHNSHISTH